MFGYGSLMWRPGFDYLEARPALLRGYHRAFCVYSSHYRGTPQHPGLVLGLDRGGSCRGLAFRVARENVEWVTEYLNERELVSYAYQARTLPVDAGGDRLGAYAFVADPRHRQYAGDLGIDRTAAIIMDAAGQAGLNRDYLINTVRQLEHHGYLDRRLHDLLREVERLTGLIDLGSGI